ncbi:Ger(x)C family spore germination protein [Pullulanibacillus sp. KACC 23026]|uniref:Ger(x)C family spore germination protein n=1 Tax=Pullulanibacillus sp. KACC 23026 TaxID=3028315 RepID=UPI0023AF45D4|nr:Ger(x)C family spore germination protein [Pullulanibacillus sp. KACC 23026]WEG12129.1 Ger(x)C family spore germination protein [Pullulanibacillus sp. KACC 23026]
MTTKKTLFLLLCSSIFLTGCWDQKVIQDIYYVASVGIDYQDNKYITYLKLLDFSTIAKTEQGKPTEAVPIWILTGSGQTLFDAIRDAKRMSQQNIVFSHVNTFILSESAIKHHLDDTLDLLRRYPDFRLSGWIFGTKDDIMSILNSNPVLNNSPLTLIENTPKAISKQYNRITPLETLEFNREYCDTNRTVFLPNLSLTDSWYSGGKPNPLPRIDGAFLFHDKKYYTWFSDDSLIGYRWLTPHTERTLLNVHDSKHHTAFEVAVWKVKPKIKTYDQNGTPKFDVHIKGKATILNKLENQQNPKRLIQEEIKKEIQFTYNKGLTKNLDLLELENTLYRQNNPLWKKTKGNIGFSQNMLRHITVNITIINSGKIDL